MMHAWRLLALGLQKFERRRLLAALKASLTNPENRKNSGSI